MLTPDNNGSGPRKRSVARDGDNYLLEPDINGVGGVTESDSDSELKKPNNDDG